MHGLGQSVCLFFDIHTIVIILIALTLREGAERGRGGRELTYALLGVTHIIKL